MCDECAAMADLDRCLANASSREKYSLNAAMRDFTLFWITSAPTMHPECGTWTSELNFHVSLANTCWDISLKKPPQNLRGSPSTAETIRPSDGQSHISIPTDRLLARLKISQDAFVINVWKYELFKGFFQESQTENMHSSCDTQCSLSLSLSLSWIPGCNLGQMISLPACFPDDQREENFLGVNLNDDL